PENRRRTSISQHSVDPRTGAEGAFANHGEQSPGGPCFCGGIHRPNATPDAIGSGQGTVRFGAHLVGALGAQPTAFLKQDVTSWRNGSYVTVIIREFDRTARFERSAVKAGAPLDFRRRVARAQ